MKLEKLLNPSIVTGMRRIGHEVDTARKRQRRTGEGMKDPVAIMSGVPRDGRLPVCGRRHRQSGSIRVISQIGARRMFT